MVSGGREVAGKATVLAVSLKDNFFVDGVKWPAPYEVSIKPIYISRSWTNIEGVFVDKLIRMRWQITWRYKTLSGLDASKMNNQIQSKILNTGRRDKFVVRTRFFDENKEFTMYYPAETEIRSVYAAGGGGSIWTHEIIWTEPVGVKIRGV